LLSFLAGVSAFGQNYNCQYYPAEHQILLDTLPIEPGSISITGDIPFEVSEDGKSIKLKNETKGQDSLEICFRRVSSEIDQPVFHRDIAQYRSGNYNRTNINFSKRIKEEEIFSLGSIQSYGAITRGVTFGNRQNVFVNSSLNLQMEGDLSDDLKVSAVITDQNIPYQPEGNTQQIRDFDNVFIKLYNKHFEMIAGDIVLQNPVAGSYFLKYYKNVQGLSLRYDKQINEKWHSQSQVSGSLSKGQFNTTVIQPIESVQGPYKLRGAQGERFIIVMANSEKVYLDGKLLKRGFDRDYVIDYNLGEITFSNTIVITQFSRIRVDYEYANQYYSRSNISMTQQLTSKNANVYFNYYRAKDNPNSTLGFSLDQADINVLRQLGDNHGVAAISGIDSTGYLENAILYKKKDTVDASGNSIIIYEISTDPNLAMYKISFTDVGTQKGAYALLNSTSNGKSYEWVGKGNGDYLPVQVIPTPNSKQMFVTGASSKIGAYESVWQELAISGLDQNLYSNIDDGDNTGWAWKGGVKSEGRSLSFLPGYQLDGAVTYEFDNRNFSYIDRFRSVDYDRDWSYDVFSDSVKFRQDRILQSNVNLEKDANHAVSYDFKFRNRSAVINGTQQTLQLTQQLGALRFTSYNFLINNDLSNTTSRWFKSRQQVQLTNRIVKPGYLYTVDQNMTKATGTDSVLSTQMYYTSHDFFLESGDSVKTIFRADYISRTDQRPTDGEMQDYTQAEEIRFTAESRQLKNQQLGAQLNYRKVTDKTGDQKTHDNLIGKLNWIGNFADRHINNRLTFTTASVRELKREYVFVAVPTGQGNYTWRDENGDGVQQLNEFYEAINPDEKNYIKLFTPTDQYVNAYQTTLVQQLDMKMPRGWSNADGLLPVLSKLSMSANLRYNFKTTQQSLLSRVNPFAQNLTDTSVLSARNLNRYTLFFNRNAPGFGLDLTYTTQSNKSLMSGGFQLKDKSEWNAGYRIGFGPMITLRGEGAIKQTQNQSDFLASRNFQLAERDISTEVVWQPMENFRLITGYSNRHKQNEASELGETAGIHEYKLEATWLRSSKGNLNATFNWLQIDFNGQQNSYLGYEMLEALKPGTNQRWNVNWQQSIGKGLQLTLQYYGRKSTGSAVVHTGNVQVTAYF